MAIPSSRISALRRLWSQARGFFLIILKSFKGFSGVCVCLFVFS